MLSKSLTRSLVRNAQQYKLACNPVYLLFQQRDVSSKAESFLSGTNANFLEAQYLDWSKSKGSVDASWDSFYDSVCGPALKIEEIQDDFSPKTVKPKSSSRGSEDAIKTRVKLAMAVGSLIRSYQARGHLLAKTDPLGLTLPARLLADNKNLALDTKGVETHIVARELCSELSEKHMDMTFELPARTAIGGEETALTLREIIRRLENVYCKSIGIEYMHVLDIDQVQYLRDQMEKPGAFNRTNEEKKIIMRRLIKAVFLEKYFATKWPAEKRFGLEGGESMIAMLEEIVDTSTRLGVQSIVMAMQHRGRLNMLVNVCRKQLCDVFAQFKPMEPKERVSGSKDHDIAN